MARTGRPFIQGKISYSTAHARVASHRGKAKQRKCVGCGGPAHHWSYRGFSEVEQSEERLYRPTGAIMVVFFSPDPFDYDPICLPCHRVRDRDLLTKRLELAHGNS